MGNVTFPILRVHCVDFGIQNSKQNKKNAPNNMLGTEKFLFPAMGKQKMALDED